MLSGGLKTPDSSTVIRARRVVRFGVVASVVVFLRALVLVVLGAGVKSSSISSCCWSGVSSSDDSTITLRRVAARRARGVDRRHAAGVQAVQLVRQRGVEGCGVGETLGRPDLVFAHVSQCARKPIAPPPRSAFDELVWR